MRIEDADKDAQCEEGGNNCGSRETEQPCEQHRGEQDEWTEVSLDRGVVEESKEDIPTADPVHIHLMPWGLADSVTDAESALVIQSGSANVEEDRAHRLSRIVLQLAVLNFLLALCLELYTLVVHIVKGDYVSIIFFLFWVGFAYYVMWLGVQGVRTRNATCCDSCNNCGFLQAFHFIYVVFAVLRAVRFLVALVLLQPKDIVSNFLLLIITSATAEYSRQLLVAIQKLPPVIRARLPPEIVPIPLATAQPLPA